MSADLVEEIQAELGDVESTVAELSSAVTNGVSCETASDLSANLDEAIETAERAVKELKELRLRLKD